MKTDVLIKIGEQIKPNLIWMHHTDDSVVAFVGKDSYIIEHQDDAIIIRYEELGFADNDQIVIPIGAFAKIASLVEIFNNEK